MDHRQQNMSSLDDFGRLDVVLDRSWEVQPVTWSSLTWWDKLPCGQELISSLSNPDPLPFPSPALSVIGHPPTPRRKLPPTHLNFRSSSASPIPARSYPERGYQGYSAYSNSPLACPLPASPDSQSFNSVFLHSESSPGCQSSTTPSPHYLCSSPLLQQSRAIFPTPPDSMHRRYSREQYLNDQSQFSMMWQTNQSARGDRRLVRRKFSFSRTSLPSQQQQQQISSTGCSPTLKYFPGDRRHCISYGER